MARTPAGGGEAARDTHPSPRVVDATGIAVDHDELLRPLTAYADRFAYGRRSQWRSIARGQLLTWGRRRWIAVRLTSYLVAP
jgi:hypothetical protein